MNLINKNSIVRKHNDLINARYSYTLEEQRIILCVLSQIKKNDKDFKAYRVYVKDFLNIFESDTHNMHNNINEKYGNKKDRINNDIESLIEKSIPTPQISQDDEDIIDKEVSNKSELLMKKIIHIPREDGGFLKVAWASSIKYFKKLGYIEVKFSDELKPYLLELNDHFKAYTLQNIIKLKSIHSIRIYELLKQYESIGKRTFIYSELKKILDVSDKYKRFQSFKEYVLERSKRDLFEYTDIFFTYKMLMKNHSADKIIFSIYKNNKNVNKKIYDLTKNLTEEQRLAMQEKEEFDKVMLEYNALGIEDRQKIKKIAINNIKERFEKNNKKTTEFDLSETSINFEIKRIFDKYIESKRHKVNDTI